MAEREQFRALEEWVNHQVLGQERLVRRLLVALLADGHLLVEGVPGLAKTRVVRVLAAGIEGEFQRIQFTPDLLPADLIGTEVFHPESGTFQFQKGPIFHNFVLADEINRAPAKVQSALLEAMAERQVTVGRHTWPLDELFLVMATQNPIEQEGTYPLPEAQRDRFLLHVRVDYPDLESEQRILQLVREQMRTGTREIRPERVHLSRQNVLAARREALDLYLAPELERFLVELVAASRDPSPYDAALAELIAYGASPRGSIALDLASRAHAWLAGREHVSPEDVLAIVHDALRHRILLSYDAEADGVTPDETIDRLLALVPLP